MIAPETTHRMRRVTDWLWSLREPDAGSAPVVVLFPFAGGSAYSLADLARHLPDGPGVLGVQYPGRGPRMADGAAGSIAEIARGVAADVAALDGGHPTLLGHSMGAIVAFEVARILEGRGRAPAQLVALAARPPHVSRADAESLHEYPRERLVAALRARGGLPEEALRDDEILDMLVPVVRADFALLAAHPTVDAGCRLACAVVAAGGDDDRAVPTETLRRWAELTAADAEVHVFAGGHFFHRSHPTALAELTARRLAAPAASYPSLPAARAGRSVP